MRTEPTTPRTRGTTPQSQSPVIWRCRRCGALVHPADHDAPAAWCSRCGRMTEAGQDGGG